MRWPKIPEVLLQGLELLAGIGIVLAFLWWGAACRASIRESPAFAGIPAVDPAARFREIHKEGFDTAGPDVRIIEDTETGCLYFANWRQVIGADGQPAGCREVPP